MECEAIRQTANGKKAKACVRNFLMRSVICNFNEVQKQGKILGRGKQRQK
jgi:hypothetical protein